MDEAKRRMMDHRLGLRRTPLRGSSDWVRASSYLLILLLKLTTRLISSVGSESFGSRYRSLLERDDGSRVIFAVFSLRQKPNSRFGEANEPSLGANEAELSPSQRCREGSVRRNSPSDRVPGPPTRQQSG